MGAFAFNQDKEVEWADVTLIFGGSPLVKFTGFKYGQSTDKEHLYAGGNKPVSIQSGNKKPSGSFKLLKGAFDVVQRAAIAAGGDDVTDIVFDAAFSYKPVGTRPVQNGVVQGIEVTNFEYAMEQNAKKMEIELPYLAMAIVND